MTKEKHSKLESVNVIVIEVSCSHLELNIFLNHYGGHLGLSRRPKINSACPLGGMTS